MKLVAAVAYVLVVVLGMPFLIEGLLADYVFGKDTLFLMTGNPFVLYVVFGLYLFFVIVWLYSKDGLFYNAVEGEPGFKAHLPKKVRVKVIAWEAT